MSQPATSITVAISVGELVDKVTILEIKAERIRDSGQLRNVLAQLEILRKALAPLRQRHADLDRLAADLRAINETLWTIEDDIRDCERTGDFGPRFVGLARGVYHNNDRRAAIKRQIDELTGSRIVEEKSYQVYD